MLDLYNIIVMNGETNDDMPKVKCKVCGKKRKITSSDICAVSVGTKIANDYNLDKDDKIDQGFIPVCDGCYEKAC